MHTRLLPNRGPSVYSIHEMINRNYTVILKLSFFAQLLHFMTADKLNGLTIELVILAQPFHSTALTVPLPAAVRMHEALQLRFHSGMCSRLLPESELKL